MDSLVQDLAYAFRSLRRSPGYAAAVIATLAIGIGPLTAVFGVVHSVLINPLPFKEPDRLVQIWTGSAEQPHGPTAPANFIDLQKMNRSFVEVAAEDFGWFNLTDGTGQPERLYGAIVSPSFFPMILAHPFVGRGFTEDDQRSPIGVAVISHRVWQQRYGGDPKMLGRAVTMNDEAYRIVGVMPAELDFLSLLIGERVDVWTPTRWTPATLSRGVRRLGITARLKPGVTLAQAQADLAMISAALAAQYPLELGRMSMRLFPLQEELVGSSRRLLLILFGAVSLILLIACANVSNLALARAQSREREIHIRAALGAGRGRLLRQLLSENLVLALTGGVIGLIAAAWITAALVASAPRKLPRVDEIGVDSWVFLCALAAALASSFLFGLAPALQVHRGRLDTLTGSGHTSTDDRPRRRRRNGVVSLEIGLALVLLVSAGLLLRSLQRLDSVNPGFDSQAVVTATVILPDSRFDREDQQLRYVEACRERLAAIHGAKYVAAIDYLPFGRSDLRLGISVDEASSSTAGEGPSAHIRSATSDYFAALRIPVLRGRAFTRNDRIDAPRVAIINESMARRDWPNDDLAAVVGRRVAIGSSPRPEEWHTIVGVVGNVKHRTLGDAPEPELYYPMSQAPSPRVNFVVRGEREAAALIGAIRTALLDVDRRQPVEIHPLEELVGATTAEARFRGGLLAAFAFVALTLAIVGVYGTVSFAVSRRTREIGVRVALGARSTAIMVLILREGALLVIVGLVIGFATSFVVTRTLREMLFEVSPTDAVTFAAVGLLLALTAMLANYLPARHAATVDPMIVMRSE
jgi:putative ABC transport system permease protein